MQRRLPHPPVERYEGLIFTHSLRVLGRVDDDLDDIRQQYRIKVWTALVAYDPERCRTDVDRFVFFCLKNAEKDMLKRRRRPEVSLETADPSERQGAVDAEVVYAQVEAEQPLLPSTLSGLEVRAVVLLYRGYRQTEAARRLGIDARAMKRTVRSIRDKMADWKPDSSPDLAADLKPELPAELLAGA